MMEFEADRMTGLILKDENVLPERDVVLEEFNMRVANNPDARLTEQIMAALYLNHPYGRPIIGWRQEIEKLDREDALAFYKRFYAPNNAILVIAGDVDAKEVRPMVEKAYGGIPAQPAISAHRVRPQEPVPAAPRTVTLSDPRVEQTGLRRYYLVPSSTTGCGRRRPRARRARAIDGRRLQFLSLPRAGDRPSARDQRRRRLPGHFARSLAVLDLGFAKARRGVFASRAGDRRRDCGRHPEIPPAPRISSGSRPS
jgi:zinc protease